MEGIHESFYHVYPVRLPPMRGGEECLRRRGGRCTQFVHGRGSRVSIDPRIPTMPGRSTSGFHQPGRHCLHHARRSVRCSASRMKGELHPSKNHSYDGLRHLVPTFFLMDDSANEIFCFLVWPLQRQQWVLLYYITTSWVP